MTRKAETVEANGPDDGAQQATAVQEHLDAGATITLPTASQSGQFTDLDPLKRAFLTAYSQTGRVGDASRATGVSRQVTWLWRRADPVFQELFDDAYQDFRETLEAGAMARLAVGYEGKGGSDLLYITMMNAAWPEKYRQTVVVDDRASDTMAEVKAIVSQARKRQRAEAQDRPEVSVQEQADAVVRAKVGGKA